MKTNINKLPAYVTDKLKKNGYFYMTADERTKKTADIVKKLAAIKKPVNNGAEKMLSQIRGEYFE